MESSRDGIRDDIGLRCTAEGIIVAFVVDVFTCECSLSLFFKYGNSFYKTIGQISRSVPEICCRSHTSSRT